MSNVKSRNPIVRNALSAWDELMDIYLDRAATEGKMGDTKEAAMWFDKAKTLRMIMKRADPKNNGRAVATNDKDMAIAYLDAFRKDVKSKISDLSIEANQALDLIVSYGRGARDRANMESRTDVWRDVEAIGTKIIPDLKKAVAIISNLKNAASSI